MNYLLWGLFGPVTWPLWFAVIAAAALLTGHVRLAHRAIWIAALMGICLAFLPLGPLLMHSLERHYPPAPPPAKIDHILVLAGGEDLQASLWSKRIELTAGGDRVVNAVLAARENPEAQLWTVGYGDSARNAANDTQLIAAFWQDSGIAAGRIHQLPNTADTCANTRAFSAAGNVLLITSAFHMPRAMACARAAGLAVIPYPVDYRSRPGIRFSPDVIGNLENLNLAAHEYVGMAWYRLTGRID